MKISFALFCLLLLIARFVTATDLYPTNQSKIKSRIITERDDFKKNTHFQGPEIKQDGVDGGVSIHAFKSDINADATYKILVLSIFSGRWRYYDTAYDSIGSELDARSISREVMSCDERGCKYAEAVSINITRDYLEKSATTGITFQLSGKGGKTVYTIPAAYVQEFLSVVKH